MSKLLAVGEQLALSVDEKTTTFMVLSRKDGDGPSLQEDNVTFKKVENAKYPGKNINCKNEKKRNNIERE